MANKCSGRLERQPVSKWGLTLKTSAERKLVPPTSGPKFSTFVFTRYASRLFVRRVAGLRLVFTNDISINTSKITCCSLATFVITLMIKTLLGLLHVLMSLVETSLYNSWWRGWDAVGWYPLAFGEGDRGTRTREWTRGRAGRAGKERGRKCWGNFRNRQSKKRRNPLRRGGNRK